MILSLRSILDSQDTLLEKNQYLSAKLEAISLECDAMRQSSSWRVTLPLRWVRDRMRRRLRGLALEIQGKLLSAKAFESGS
jgi:hypothetical protein